MYVVCYRPREIESSGSKVLRKKPIRQFHERPKQVGTKRINNKNGREDVGLQTKNSELTYNDIYKQMSATHSRNDIYHASNPSKNNLVYERNSNRVSINNDSPVGSNNRQGVKNDVDDTPEIEGSTREYCAISICSNKYVL